MRSTHRAGITLIEVLVGVSILAVSLVFIGYTITLFSTSRAALLEETARLYLAEEGYELVRTLRDDDWATLASLPLETEHALTVSTTTVALAGSVPEMVDGRFARTFELRALYRDGGDDIVASTTVGATADPNAREVIVRAGNGTATTTFHGVLTNLFTP